MRKILIFEDSVLTMERLKEILSEDYELHIVTKGSEVLKTAMEINPDIVLLDTTLTEGVTGYDVIKQLKNEEKTKEIPVFFLTVNTDAKSEEKGLLLGAFDYIRKPFSPLLVKARINNCMKLVEKLEEHQKLCNLDALTGLYNRYYFDLQMNAEWSRSIRENRIISILMFDIDHFKNYNDQYGHLKGDIALKAIAEVMQNNINRPGDFVVRWGGEEFVTLLPETRIRGALTVAKKIRADVENIRTLERKITVSGGVCAHRPTYKCSMEGFIESVDAALYKAKEAGRNRIEVADRNIETLGYQKMKTNKPSQF